MRQLAQLVVRPPRVFERLGEERLRALVTLLVRAGRELQRDDRVHEPLLRAVVEIADDAPALLVAGRHDARAGRGDLRAALGVRDRRGDEVGEAGEPLLGAGRQRLGALRRGDDAPQTVLDDDRGADRAVDAGRAARCRRPRRRPSRAPSRSRPAPSPGRRSSHRARSARRPPKRPRTARAPPGRPPRRSPPARRPWPRASPRGAARPARRRRAGCR